jgi:hypothetical protein
MKHRWTKIDRVLARCERCGMTRTLRPHPYVRRWYFEFVPAEGGQPTNTLYGARTPPCRGTAGPR